MVLKNLVPFSNPNPSPAHVKAPTCRYACTSHCKIVGHLPGRLALQLKRVGTPNFAPTSEPSEHVSKVINLITIMKIQRSSPLDAPGRCKAIAVTILKSWMTAQQIAFAVGSGGIPQPLPGRHTTGEYFLYRWAFAMWGEGFALLLATIQFEGHPTNIEHHPLGT